MDNSGAILGPLLAFGILAIFPGNYRNIFIIAAIPGILGLISLAIFVKEAKRDKKELLGKFCLKDFPKRYYIFLLIVFVFTMGNSTDALLLVRANDIGIQSTFVPLLYLIFNSVSALFSIPMGMFSDKIGRERLIIFGYLLYSILYFGFGRTNSIAVIILLFALYGLYSASTDGVQKALVSDLIDKDKRGTGLGLYNCIVGLTLLPASIIGGLLYDNLSNSAPFYFGAVTALIAAICMMIFYRKGLVVARKQTRPAKNRENTRAILRNVQYHYFKAGMGGRPGIATSGFAYVKFSFAYYKDFFTLPPHPLCLSSPACTIILDSYGSHNVEP